MESKWIYLEDFSLSFFFLIIVSVSFFHACIKKAGRGREEELFEVEIHSLFLVWTSVFHACATES